MKIGTTEIQKVYLGTTELDGLYFGENSAYKKPSSGGIDANTYLMFHCDGNMTDSSQYSSGFSFYNEGNTFTYDDNGKFGKALKNVTGYAGARALLQNNSFSDINSEMTLDYWYYIPDSSNSPQSFRLLSNDGGDCYAYFYKYNSLTALLYLNGTPIGLSSYVSSALTTNAWHHLAWVFKTGEYLKLYIDGNLVYTNTTNLYNFSSGLSTQIHLNSSSDASVCLLDEIRLSNIVRWNGNFTPPTQPYS